MRYTPRITKALKKAAVLHRFQLRKSEDAIPYIIHPYAVAILLSNYTDDEDVIIAGLLHDTIEDTKYTLEELENDFGKRVLEIVDGVTEQQVDNNGDDLSWKTRKDIYIRNLYDDSQEALLLCSADKICNMQDRLDDLKKFGSKKKVGFHSTPEERYWFHSEILKVLKEKLVNNKILGEYERVLEETRLQLEKKS